MTTGLGRRCEGASRVAGVLLLLGGGSVQAQPLPPPDPRATASFVLENDSLKLSGPPTDRWYTSGVRFGWSSAENNLPGPLAIIDGGLASLFGAANTRWRLDFGQNFFTPLDKHLEDPDPRDRPYAGILYGTIGLDRRTWRTLDRFELQLGVIGPASGARDTQSFIHRLTNDPIPEGWGRQLHNEPVFNINAERIWRLPVAGTGIGEVDVLPTVGAQLGTVRVAASAGARLRFGQGLERDFGAPRIRPTIGDPPAPVGEGFGWYVFGGVGGYAVARDIFLDGNTWRDSRSVDKRNFVADFEVGAAVFWRNIRLSYTQVWRTKEFEDQSRIFTFGSVSLAFAF
jgi:lipid A 3-O-deacylase